jgi:hypothetical protein
MRRAISATFFTFGCDGLSLAIPLIMPHTQSDECDGVDRVDHTTPRRNWIAERLASWNVLDWALALYVIVVAMVAVVWSAGIPRWLSIVVAHGALLGAMLLLPARGAPWEVKRPSDSLWMARTRELVRFLRFTYPALLLTPFFEETALTVNAAAQSAPYWFEPHLYAADAALFGGNPAVMLSQAGVPIVDEVMHAFYFSHYPLVITGIILAWNRGTRGREKPAPGFHTAMTCMMLGFFLSFVWYPFLPARGPWENAALMSGLRPFGGWLFTRLIEIIIAGAAVSGSCFPSAHISGTWALTLGLVSSHPKVARWFTFLAVGLSVACVYTRYHHGVDVLAGFAVAVVASLIGYRLTREPQPA